MIDELLHLIHQAWHTEAWCCHIPGGDCYNPKLYLLGDINALLFSRQPKPRSLPPSLSLSLLFLLPWQCKSMATLFCATSLQQLLHYSIRFWQVKAILQDMTHVQRDRYMQEHIKYTSLSCFDVMISFIEHDMQNIWTDFEFFILDIPIPFQTFYYLWWTLTWHMLYTHPKVINSVTRKLGCLWDFMAY